MIYQYIDVLDYSIKKYIARNLKSLQKTLRRQEDWHRQEEHRRQKPFAHLP